MKTTTLKKLYVMFLIGTITSGFSQIIFEQSLNNQALGTYTLDEVKSDFITTSANGFIRKGVGEDRVSIVNTGKVSPSGKCMKVKYPKGKVDSKESGAGWRTDLKNNYNELYLSYYVKFETGFNYLTKIGKLPGLAGGLNYQDSGRDTEWSGKLMWRHDGQLQFYLHQPITNEKEFFWGVEGGVGPRLTDNKWHHIQIRYKLNSVTNGVANKNGIMQAWFNGVEVANYTNIQFRKNASVGINSMFFSTFFGGNVTDDAPTRDEYAYFDDFKVSTSKIPYVAPSARNNSSNTEITTNENISNEIRLYPNPVKDNLFTLSGLKEFNSDIIIYNELGIEVKKILALDEENHKINISDLSSGIYFVKIINNEEEKNIKFFKE